MRFLSTNPKKEKRKRKNMFKSTYDPTLQVQTLYY